MCQKNVVLNSGLSRAYIVFLYFIYSDSEDNSSDDENDRASVDSQYSQELANLTSEINLKQKLIEHIKENSKEKNIFLDFINCVEEHVNMTISLGADQAISKVAQLIKGESSNWINKNKLIKNHFEWQDEYIAVSVSESMIDQSKRLYKKPGRTSSKKEFY